MARLRTEIRGFTLLELLAAMALMVVTASCLYTALYTGFRSRQSALAAVEPTSQALNAIELLKQDVYGVLPPTGVLAGPFIGTASRTSKGTDADSLEFYTTQVYGSTDRPMGGIGKVTLALEDDDRSRNPVGYRLVRRVTTNLLSPRSIDPDEQVLCRNVMSLSLRYFDGDRWLDTWDSTADANSLPKAVEVGIELIHNSRRSNGNRETRRLVQSFPIPCGLFPRPTEETTGGAAPQAGGQPGR